MPWPFIPRPPESPARPRGAVRQGQGHDRPQAQHLRDGGVEQRQPCAVLVSDSGAGGSGAQLTIQLLLKAALNLGNGAPILSLASPQLPTSTVCACVCVCVWVCVCVCVCVESLSRV